MVHCKARLASSGTLNSKLRHRVEPDDGSPRSSGGNAIVYRFEQQLLVKGCPSLHEPAKPERQARYQIVHDYLQQARPRCLVEFGYDPGGIRINGGWFPIQTLDWVEGETLGEWLKGAVDAATPARSSRWLTPGSSWLAKPRTDKIAHGDLQHGNVMVVNDRLVLVDYDCMFVPSMKTDKDREAWEDGLPGYQHPKRPGQDHRPSSITSRPG